MHLSKFTLLSLLTLSAASRAFACDLCGCYTPRLEVVHEKPFAFYVAVAEQFTHFGTDRLNGNKVENPTGQYLDSSITQAVIGATFLQSRAGLQLSVPYIYRSFKRPEGFDIEHGHESGLGDLSLLANFVVFRTGGSERREPAVTARDGKSVAMIHPSEPDFSASLNLLAGVKFPTGDASRIKEEFVEEEIEGAPASGIHGHDLALGTGSWDGIFGAQAFLRYKAVFFDADVRYTLRGRGHYSYRFADDLQWSGGPGVYLYRRGGDTLGLQCVVAGETKGYDHFQGEPATDTGVTSLYVGPRISGAFGPVSGDVGVDFPVLMNTTSFQTTPDYRIRAGLSIHF
jgi:hypothetical protein